MSIYAELKQKALSMRKDPEQKKFAPSVQFALSEIEKVGKNAGNRQTTDDEAIKVLQKIVSNLRDNVNLVDSDSIVAKDANIQIEIFESVLPQMATEQEVRAVLDNAFVAARPTNKGAAMKILRDQFGAKVDMKRAGEIVTEVFGL